MWLLQEGLFECPENVPGNHSFQPLVGELIGTLAWCVPLGYTGWQGEVSCKRCAACSRLGWMPALKEDAVWRARMGSSNLLFCQQIPCGWLDAQGQCIGDTKFVQRRWPAAIFVPAGCYSPTHARTLTYLPRTPLPAPRSLSQSSRLWVLSPAGN